MSTTASQVVEAIKKDRELIKSLATEIAESPQIQLQITKVMLRNFSTKEDLEKVKSYTDEKFAEMKSYTDEKFAEMKSYTDEKFAEMKSYTDEKFAEMKSYTDVRIGDLDAKLTSKIEDLDAKFTSIIDGLNNRITDLHYRVNDLYRLILASLIGIMISIAVPILLQIIVKFFP